MRQRALLGVVLLGALFFVFSPADAFTFGGVHDYGNYWTTRMGTFGHGPFDLLRVDWISGTKFQLPVFQNFTNESGWTVHWAYPTAATAGGPSRSSQSWDLIIEGPIATPMSLHATKWNGDTLLDSAVLSWRGTTDGWLETPSTWRPEDPDIPPIPEPGVMKLMIVVACAGFGILVRKRWDPLSF